MSGEITVPGDKSISHRAVMFGSLAKGTTRVTHFLQGADCLSTIDCFQKMGVFIEEKDNKIYVSQSFSAENKFSISFRGYMIQAADGYTAEDLFKNHIKEGE